MKKADLLEQFKVRGVPIPEDPKVTNKKLEILLGIDYYNKHPEVQTWGMQQRLFNFETPQLCYQFKELKPDEQQRILESEDWMADVKIDGCFPYNTPILLSDGSYLPIGYIVDNKINAEVLSYDEATQSLIPKRITNWFNNGHKDSSEWMNLKYKVDNNKLKVTINHKIYTTNRGWVRADSIDSSDELLQHHKGLNETQTQLVLGSFLGDGCIIRENRTKYRFGSNRLALGHSVKQEDYLTKKHNTLGVLAGKMEKYTTGYGFPGLRTRSRPILELNNLIRSNYIIKEDNKNVKIITRELLEKLNPLGYAIWYMDDGSRTHSKEDNINNTNKSSRARLAVNNFSVSDLDIVVSYFKDLNLSCSYHSDYNRGYYLEFNTESSKVFFDIIAPYVINSMEYKLPKSNRGNSKIEWWLDNKLISKVFTTNITSSIKYAEKKDAVQNHKYKTRAWKGGPYSDTAYDLEIEDTHCYFAEDLLVHNCRFFVCYSPEEGFEFFSRDVSESRFLQNTY